MTAKKLANEAHRSIAILCEPLPVDNNLECDDENCEAFNDRGIDEEFCLVWADDVQVDEIVDCCVDPSKETTRD